MVSRRIGMSAAAGAGLFVTVLVGVAAGRLTTGAIDPAIGSSETTRPWRHVESHTPADASAGEPAAAFASLAPSYFVGSTSSSFPHEPVTTAHDFSDRELDAETRRLDAKLDAEIRQGDRDAKRAADRFQDAPVEQLDPGTTQELLRSAPLPVDPQDAPQPGDAQPGAAAQGPGPTT